MRTAAPQGTRFAFDLASSALPTSEYARQTSTFLTLSIKKVINAHKYATPARRGADGLRRSCLEVGCDRLGRDAALLGLASLDRALLPAEVELDPDEHSGQRRDAPPHALRELAGDRRRAGIGHGPAQAEDERAGDVVLRGALCDPGHEVAAHQCPGVEAPQQTDPDEPDRHGAEHHLVEVEVLEEEHVPDPIRAGELTPGEKEAEG